MNGGILSVLSEQTMAKPGGSIPRFHSPNLDQPTVSLDPGESSHALRVLRMTPGDTLELFDGQGRLARATILDTSRKTVTCQCDPATMVHERKPRPDIIVAAAVAKADAATVMVDMLSQVGATAWIPMLTRYSVVDPGEKKIDKWRRLAIESAKQCGRLHLMHIDDPMPFEQVIQTPANRRRILLPPSPWENQQEHPAPAAAAARPASQDNTMLLLIGPEGGFSEAEIAAAQDAGFERWSLATPVLRIETAAVVAAALARAGRGDATLEA